MKAPKTEINLIPKRPLTKSQSLHGHKIKITVRENGEMLKLIFRVHEKVEMEKTEIENRKNEKCFGWFTEMKGKQIPK